MKKYPFFYRNSLSVVFLTLLKVTLARQVLTKWKEHNNELEDARQREMVQGRPPPGTVRISPFN